MKENYVLHIANILTEELRVCITIKPNYIPNFNYLSLDNSKTVSVIQ